MNYRRFGRTGLQVSEIAFGCGRTGGILIDADDDTRRKAVRRALDLGVNWFDTAAQYGQGKSEQALGWLLAEIPDRPFVSTKVMVDGNDRRDIAGQVQRSIEASLKRLRRDSVDLLQLHNHIEVEIGPEARGRAITVDDVLGPGGAAEGLERARARGLTRFIGLSALGDAASTIRVIDSGRFDAAQVYYNLINPSAARAPGAMPPAWRGYRSGGVLDACRRHDMAVLAIRIFAARYLATATPTGREGVLTADTDPASEARMAAAVAAALGSDCGSPAQAAVRFVLSCRDVSTAVVGLSEIGHIEQACAAAAMGPLPPAAMATLERLYASGFASA
jgi:aryl-alcohol dehydrogenase-like predicted oxidoreductase